MRGEHVVVSGDNPEVGPAKLANGVLVAGAASGEAMGEVGAAKLFARRALGRLAVDGGEVGAASGAAAGDDALGDFGDAGVEGGGHRRVLQSKIGQSEL